ncbi:MAG: diacylglycerol/lipid kinase family protein [Bacteroidota bacterium]
MKPIAVIINPAAGKGKGKKVGAWLIQALADKGVEAEIHVSNGSGEATAYARQTNRLIVVAVGGDGTINEIVNGIAGTNKILAVIPAGSGNDLIKSLKIPLNPELALDRLFSGHEKKIDIGGIVCHAPDGSNTESRYFVNGAGVGFDAAVARKTREIKFLRGLPLYIAAVLKTLGEYKSPLFEIRIDATARCGRQLLIAIGNGTSAGGGFVLTPDAQVDDGMLDICMISDLGILQILSIMPKVIRGHHTNLDRVAMATGKDIQITADSPFVVHADGEIIAECTHVSISIGKHMLTVIT